MVVRLGGLVQFRIGRRLNQKVLLKVPPLQPELISMRNPREGGGLAKNPVRPVQLVGVIITVNILDNWPYIVIRKKL